MNSFGESRNDSFFRVASLTGMALSLLVSIATHVSAQAIQFQQIGEVVTAWSSEQHLYLHGDLGIGAEQSSGLERWLDEHAPHWTVVLMQNARDQAYSDREGRQFSGMDAVEFALGHGLANRTGFGKLENPRTGETDGAVFVLFLFERKFSYYASDAQDRRGLGESQWVGDLDREAIRAMRGGGRILDAVKNTIGEIDSRLSKAIQREEEERQRQKEAAERALLERQRAAEDALREIAWLREEQIKKVEAALVAFRQTQPQAINSILSNPKIGSWQSNLTRLADSVNGDNVRELSLEIAQLKNEIANQLDLYAIHSGFESAIEPLQIRWDQVATFGQQYAVESSRAAELELRQARMLHSQGDAAFVEALRRAEQSLDQAEREIFAEKEKRAEIVRRRLAVRNSLLTAGGISTLVLVLITWWMNRRRRPVLKRAWEAFQKTGLYVDEQLQILGSLVQKAEQLIGPVEGLAARTWNGRTLSLAQDLSKQRQAVEEMANEVRRVLGEAEQQLQPGNLLGELGNFVSRARYEHCLGLLTGQTLKIPQSAQGLLEQNEAVIRIPDWMTFGEFTGIARRMAETLQTGLDRLERSVQEALPRTTELQTQIDNLAQIERELAAAAQSDRYFALPNLFAQLLPSIQADQDRAEALTSVDPVEACETHLSIGGRKISEATIITEAIRSARQSRIPRMHQQAEHLKQMGHQVDWIERCVLDLSAAANQCLGQAVSATIASSAQAWVDKFSRLAQDVERSVQLAAEIRDRILPELAAFETAIREGREGIAAILKIPLQSALAEGEYNPDRRLESARRQLAAMQTAIDFGNIANSESAQGVLQLEIERGKQLIADSKQILVDFPASLTRNLECAKQADSELTQVNLSVDRAAKEFAPAALMIPVGNEQNEARVSLAERSTESTVAATTLGSDCQHRLESARHTSDQADTCFAKGRLLEAANLIHLSDGEIGAAREELRRLAGHCQLLHQQFDQNLQTADAIANQIQALVALANDRRTGTANQSSFEALTSTSEEWIRGMKDSNPRNPLWDAEQLGKFQSQVTELEKAIQSDFLAHGEATRVIAAARTELVAARRQVALSRSDQIPDSHTVSRCQSQIEAAGQGLDEAEHRLNVAHADWTDLRQVASNLLSQLGKTTGELRQELEAASQAVQQLQRATEAVFQAANWRGAFDIRIIGDCGSTVLEVAQAALASGRYQESIAASQNAQTQAGEAIQVAERAVERQRREIARREEEQRRKSSTDFWSSGSSGSFGGLSSGGGWSSSSSHSSGSWGSSSSGGSGSGFSRSGW